MVQTDAPVKGASIMVPWSDVHGHVIGAAGTVEEEVTGLEVAHGHRRRVGHLGPREVRQAHPDLAP